MSATPGWLDWQDDALILALKIQPKASQDQIAQPFNDALKIRISAAPVDGKANQHLRRFLAKQFGVSQSRVTLLSGQSARIKRVRIERPEKWPASLAEFKPDSQRIPEK
ncbi:MAG: DUF167 family protein [gamma proteobacterium symbiont of Bathyaustriella thionipta]|nr:DUF167 family protein [gamma proteobacterium symbiont of Bathyaustriella thionipta]